jgi:phosphatidylglycerophosphatase A
LAAYDEDSQAASPVALSSSDTTVLTAAVSGVTGDTFKIDSTVNVKITFTMTNVNYANYVITYSLYRGATLLVQQDVQKLFYDTDKETLPIDEVVALTWIDTLSTSGTATYTIRISVTGSDNLTTAQAYARAINILLVG